MDIDNSVDILKPYAVSSKGVRWGWVKWGKRGLGMGDICNIVNSKKENKRNAQRLTDISEGQNHIRLRTSDLWFSRGETRVRNGSKY